MDPAREHALPLFHRYGNLSGRSGVAGYALMGNGIAVRFADGAAQSTRQNTALR